jgi:rubrerythrin
MKKFEVCYHIRMPKDVLDEIEVEEAAYTENTEEEAEKVDALESDNMVFTCPNDGVIDQDDVVFLCNKCGRDELIVKNGVFMCPACLKPGENFQCMLCDSKAVTMEVL